MSQDVLILMMHLFCQYTNKHTEV